MVNPISSPGDPLFYHHHAWLDRMWQKWQEINPSVRLTEIGGNNKTNISLPLPAGAGMPMPMPSATTGVSPGSENGGTSGSAPPAALPTGTAPPTGVASGATPPASFGPGVGT